MDVPMFAKLSKGDKLEINYLCNTRQNINYNLHFLKHRETVIMRNCDNSGNLIDLKQSTKEKPWIRLVLKTFMFNVSFSTRVCQLDCNPSQVKSNLRLVVRPS